MDSTGVSSSAYNPFKSKKVLHSSDDKPHSSDQTLKASDQSLWSSKTPEKSTHPPRRPLTHRQSLRSVNQVREAAKQLQKSDLKPYVSSDSLTSSTAPTLTQVTKPNTSKALPEKYEILGKFFNSLESSIRLLGLKRSMSTFTNISRMVENLTDRRFAYSHLAQLKFILPEGIEIKKILVRDDWTSCMKPDLLVTLNFNIIQNDEKLSGNLQIRKLFRSRLVSFCKSNPKGDEVPEDKLPEPFNQSSQVTSSIVVEKPTMGSVEDTTYNEQPLVVASHMPRSLTGSFSKQAPSHNVETVEHELQEMTPETQGLPVLKQVSNHSSVKGACVSDVASPVKWSGKFPETPTKSIRLEGKEDLSSIDGTPAKSISTPFSSTPAQATRPPVRCFMTPDEDTVRSPGKLTRRSSGRRSITFDTPVKNQKAPVEMVSIDDDICDILSEDLLASIKEKERKSLEENDPAISRAKWRKQMIAGLPRLFDILLFFFQSIKRSVVTKEELVHGILSSHLEIVDRREVDEQLRLLQDLAPEWIHEKKASTGDLHFCVNTISSPESIRTRLSEAN